MNIIKKIRGLYYGWWIVITSFVLFVFIGGTALYGFTAFFNPIIDEMKWSRAQTSIAFSLRSVEGGVMRPIIGFLVDRVGPRRCIITGVLILGGSLIFMSYTNSLLHFYLSFGLLALGFTAALGIAQYAAVANWFRKLLINAYSWRTSLVIIGITTIGLGIPLALVMRHRPEQYGYLPNGKSDNKIEVPGDQLTSEEFEEKGSTVREALRSRTFWLLLAFWTFTGFAQSALIVHEMPYLTGIGISENLAAMTMVGITISSLIGRLGFSWLGDIYKKKYLLAIGCILQVIGTFIFANIRSAWMIIPFLLTYGPGFGGPIPLLGAIQADYFGIKSYAALRGLFTFGWTIPGIIAPVAAGWIYDIYGSYRVAFLIFAAVGVLAIPSVLLIRKEGNDHK
jgi:sugar phosphate permease